MSSDGNSKTELQRMQSNIRLQVSCSTRSAKKSYDRKRQDIDEYIPNPALSKLSSPITAFKEDNRIIDEKLNMSNECVHL